MKHIHCDKCKREMLIQNEYQKQPYDLTHCYKLGLNEQSCNADDITPRFEKGEKDFVEYDLCSSCVDEVCCLIEEIKK